MEANISVFEEQMYKFIEMGILKKIDNRCMVYNYFCRPLGVHPFT